MASLVSNLATLSPATQRDLERALRGLPRFRQWNEQVTPTWNWDWRHQVALQAMLDRVTRGEVNRLLIQMPPRHGKSEATTVRYPAYRLALDPRTRVIVGAYNSDLSTRFSRKARYVAMRAGIDLSKDRTAVDDWETTAGGGFRAVGVGSGVTGTGGDLVIIDDPVKSRDEAESANYREKVWQWYTDDLYTRLEPGASLILIMTRWHLDDLAGRILASEDGPNWTVLNFPALAEEGDALGRVPGEALCPERYDLDVLARIRLVMGEYSFAALYQQDPRPREGNMFPRARVEIVGAIPSGGRRVRYWDKGGGGAESDYTAGVRMCQADGLTYVEDVVRSRLASDERNKLMRQTAQLDARIVGGVQGWVEQEPGSGGKESAELTIRLMAGFPYRAEPVSGDKVVRADPLAAQWQAGNVRLVAGPWNRDYLDEMEAFPSGVNDDQVDASSGAFNKLSLASRFLVA